MSCVFYHHFVEFIEFSNHIISHDPSVFYFGRFFRERNHRKRHRLSHCGLNDTSTDQMIACPIHHPLKKSPHNRFHQFQYTRHHRHHPSLRPRQLTTTASVHSTTITPRPRCGLHTRHHHHPPAPPSSGPRHITTTTSVHSTTVADAPSQLHFRRHTQHCLRRRVLTI